ncbi:MAG: flippase-like domain-containing protein [Gammaproteobacteria bacterium]|nr:flippase-like domain-containing protein [Gammaproteobacteria bacterium]
MRRLASVIAIVGVGLALGAPFALGGSAVLDSLRNVDPYFVIILAGLSVLAGVAKAGKLQILLSSLGQPLPFLHTLAITFATDFAFLCSPAGAAGYVVNVALLRSAATPWTVSTTVVGAEQALDLVFFAIAIPVATVFALVPLGQIAPTMPGYVYAIALIIALLSVYGLWHGRHLIISALHRFGRTIPWIQARQQRIDEFVAELRGQINTLIKGAARQNILLLLLTTLQWIIRYSVLWLVLYELGYQLPFGFLLVLQAVVLHVALWTGVPSGGGSADIGLAAALSLWVISPVIATTLLLWRFSTLYFPLILGALSIAALTWTRRSNAISITETQS